MRRINAGLGRFRACVAASRAVLVSAVLLGWAGSASAAVQAGAAPSAGLMLTADASPPTLSLTPQQVGPRTWYFRGEAGMADQRNQGFNSNSGFVVTNGGVLVFDALGTPTLGTAMLTAIRQITAQPVRILVISHFHADHFYGAAAFRAAGARILALDLGRGAVHSERSQARLEQRRQDLAPWVNAQTELIGADEWLHIPPGASQPLVLGEQHFQLIPGGGAHTAEDLMLYCADDGVLFAGDLFFSGRLPFVGDADSRAWLAALERIKETHAKVVIPGHGEASHQVANDLRLTQDYLEYLRATMGQAARDMVSFDSAYGQTDWGPWSALPAFAEANRINAYGVYLRMEHESMEAP